MAARAMTLVDMFEERFAAGLDGPVMFRIQLASPDGPSTGGGKQVVQPIKLVPVEGGPTIVIGVANTITKTADLRSCALVSEQYGQRYKGAQVPILAGAYKQLLVDFTAFFQALGLQVTTAQTVRSQRPPPASSGAGGMVAAIAVSIGALGIAAWLVLSHLHH